MKMIKGKIKLKFIRTKFRFNLQNYDILYPDSNEETRILFVFGFKREV